MIKFSWRVSTDSDWNLAEDVLLEFVDRVGTICTISNSSDADEVIAQRDVVFRVLRMPHAAQRGGWWIFVGAMLKNFHAFDQYVDERIQLTKNYAKLILKSPVADGLGG